MEAKMAAHAKRIEIASEDRPLLEKWARSRVIERRLCDRARMVLMAAEGRPAAEIAERVGCSDETAKRWRSRYEREGLGGLRDRPKTGRPLTHDDETRAKLIALACTRPPQSAEGLRRERWTYAELAEAVGVSRSRAHAILAEAEVRPHLTEQWVMSELGPEFDEQAAEVCGLCLAPPENAIVVSIDEKTGIQAKHPARADTRPAPGKPARRDNEYVRNGTQNLFACLEVHSGEVTGMPSKTRNRHDLIRFLELLEEEIPAGKEVIAITDNLSTRTTQEVDGWLAEHPRWRFQFTPKHASWLNQVEIFFSILARRLLKHGAFESEHDLAAQMLAFVEHYNLTAKPFAWTYTGKVLVA
jgi:transposase